MIDFTADTKPLAAPAGPGAHSLLTWLREGARSVVLRLPRWSMLRVSPATMAMLLLLDLVLSVLLQRAYISGAAAFDWQAALSGWASFLLLAWACYVMRPVPLSEPDPVRAPNAAALLTLIMAQTVCLSAGFGLMYIALLRSGALEAADAWVHWLAWLVPAAWSTLAALGVLIRAGDFNRWRRLVAVCAVVLGNTFTYFLAPPSGFWQQAMEESVEETGELFRLTQDIMEAQLPLLDNQLDTLAPQRPGVADMYSITFAPYEGEEVFRRESAMVSEVMIKRFDTGGRSLQLLNHQQTASTLPWATQQNLERAIAGIAQIMDRDEDMLFIHLTSHGANDGELAANFWPLEVEPVMPDDLKRWLDEAGIRYRVLSISACYAGNWIAPLANDETLVMTASDANTTSFGCGRKSRLTYFGRAMFDEQLRTSTLSFEQAHAAARKVILKRETEAGKDDGYSNPQIKVGSNIGPYLKRLEARLQERLNVR